MSSRFPPRPVHLLFGAALLLGFGLPLGGQERLDHRDDFRMNSISGGDFRQYISDHVVEEDRWGHAMRLFGTFHNHMHEMMTDLALYGAEELGDGDRVPDFRLRISGGGWGEYRERLEEDGVRSPWRDFVQTTEIMHDRVHHAMYKSTLMTEWALHGAGKEEPACRPPPVGERFSGGEWRAYAQQVEGCGEESWRHFVQVVALMHDRIRDMMYRAMLHHAEAHEPG